MVFDFISWTVTSNWNPWINGLNRGTPNSYSSTLNSLEFGWASDSRPWDLMRTPQLGWSLLTNLLQLKALIKTVFKVGSYHYECIPSHRLIDCLISGKILLDLKNLTNEVWWSWNTIICSTNPCFIVNIRLRCKEAIQSLCISFTLTSTSG